MRNAVAVGYQGAVYWTADGGETWRKGSTDTLSSLYSVSMADALHGWDLTPKEAVALQKRLRDRVIREDRIEVLAVYHARRRPRAFRP